MFSKPGGLSCILLIFLYGCSFIDLTPLDITSCPGEAGDILKEEDDIRLSFTLAVDRHEAENLLRIYGPSGLMEGDFRWDGNILYYMPLSGFQPGYRHTLSFQGELTAIDGKHYSKDILLPFYYITDNAPPLLTASYPADAAEVDIYQPLVLTFDHAMDTQSTEDAFSVRPATGIRFTWSNDDTVLTITPEKQWTNLQYYSWTISQEGGDVQGITLPQEYTGSFLVQRDISAPVLLDVHPARDNGDGSFTVMEFLSPDELVNGDHIALVFNEEISFSSLSSCFRLSPSLDGYLLSLGPDIVLYYLLERITPDQAYTLTIREGLEDLSGNPASEETTITFSPDVRALDILMISIDHAGGRYDILPDDYNQSAPFIISGFQYYGTSPDYFLNISIELSEGFTDGELSERQAFADTVSLLPVFPPGATTPDEYISSWMSDTAIQFQFRDFPACTAEEPVYYRLKITGGDADAANANGSYLLETAALAFRGALE